MTKFWTISDLHQEFARDSDLFTNPMTVFDPWQQAPDDFDAIILAGDVDVSLENSLRWIADRLLDCGKPVFYVPGNHDYYVTEGDTDQFTMAEMKVRGAELAEYFGINLMMNDAIVVDDTRVIGTTLWTDMVSVGRGMSAAKEREAAGRTGMNDYKRIKRSSTTDPTKRKRLRPEDTILEHVVSRGYIERTLAVPHDGPTVVVTHHAPHPQSLDHRFKDLTYCYASNLQLLIEEFQPELWVHGHIHFAVDYTIGSTRIASNPRGYAFDPREAANGFQPDLVLEVDAPAPKPGW
ncbi:MAG: metallophosphoesterase [Cypionkella sp.]